MSRDFESLTRPFQTGDVTPPRTIPPASGTTPPLVKLRLGRTGGTKTFHGSISHSTTLYNKKYPKETETDEA